MVKGNNGIIINSKTTCNYALMSNLPQKMGTTRKDTRKRHSAMPHGKRWGFKI